MLSAGVSVIYEQPLSIIKPNPTFVCVTPASPIVDSSLLHSIGAVVGGIIDYEVKGISVEIFCNTYIIIAFYI